jgi:hypothetical protein
MVLCFCFWGLVIRCMMLSLPNAGNDHGFRLEARCFCQLHRLNYVCMYVHLSIVWNAWVGSSRV